MNKFNKFYSQFDNIISLGYRCYTKIYLHKYYKEEETNIFDWLGTGIYSMNLLLLNKFDGLLDYKNYKIFDGCAGRKVYNKKYYINFFHDLDENNFPQQNDDKWKEFVEKYRRRTERFYEKIKNSKKILFVREEKPSNLKDEQFDDKFRNKQDYEHLIEFVKIIKNINPNIDVFILFISKNCRTQFDSKNNIIVINGEIHCTYDKSADCINDILNIHEDFIYSLKI